MKILITGGARFIGRHLCDKYTKERHTVSEEDVEYVIEDVRNFLSCTIKEAWKWCIK